MQLWGQKPGSSVTVGNSYFIHISHVKAVTKYIMILCLQATLTDIISTITQWYTKIKCREVI